MNDSHTEWISSRGPAIRVVVKGRSRQQVACRHQPASRRFNSALPLLITEACDSNSTTRGRFGARRVRVVTRSCLEHACREQPVKR